MHDFQIQMTAADRRVGARAHDTIDPLHNADLGTLDAGFAPLQLVA